MAAHLWRRVLTSYMLTDFYNKGFVSWLVDILKSSHLDTSWKVGISIPAWKLCEACNRRIFATENIDENQLLVHTMSIFNHTLRNFHTFNSLM